MSLKNPWFKIDQFSINYPNNFFVINFNLSNNYNIIFKFAILVSYQNYTTHVAENKVEPEQNFHCIVQFLFSIQIHWYV